MNWYEKYKEMKEENELLKKEKEWLLDNYIKTLYKQMGEYTEKEYKTILTDAMRQTLKE